MLHLPGWSSLVATMLLLSLNNNIILAQTLDDPYNIHRFNDIRLHNPEALCRYMQCQPTNTKCPDGALWIDHVAMYGCCGGCVKFKGTNEKCTGSIDPLYGDGYCDSVDGELSCNVYVRSLDRPSSFNASLRTSSDNDQIIESSWCEYGLECFSISAGNSGNNQCAPPKVDDGAPKTCKQVQEALNIFKNSFDYSSARDDYLWIPDCTIEGLYKPKQCKGPIDNQRCICVDPNGNSIYGAAFPFQEDIFKTMNCECSRRVWEQIQSGIMSPTLHCIENGNYEPLQCENSYCYCIDPNTTLTYGPTVPEKAMFILPCYNKTLLGENDKYLRLCDSKYHSHSILRTFMTDKGYTEAPLTSISCDPDGSFSGMQCEGSTCKCQDKLGKNYNPTVQTKKDSGCNCARDEELLESLDQRPDLTCRGNQGGYFKYQTNTNGAYCMDEHGIRISSKVKQEFCHLLGCGAATNCQGGHTGLGPDGQPDGNNPNCKEACNANGKTCPPCVYTSYIEEDTSECDDIKGDEDDLLPCTDPFHGNT